jgi:hypothetical protein
MRQNLWGRISSCGRFSIGLPTSAQEPPRRVKNPPQVENLPHNGILRASMNAEARVEERWFAVPMAEDLVDCTILV